MVRLRLQSILLAQFLGTAEQKKSLERIWFPSLSSESFVKRQIFVT